MRDEFRAGHNSGTSTFWDTLRMFWQQEQISNWYSAIFNSDDRTEVCQNLICLSADLHLQWGRGEFALKPARLSSDRKKLEVQLFWMNSPRTRVGKMPITKAPSLDLSKEEHDYLSFSTPNALTRTHVKSGSTITLQTDNPALRPLPDIRLLEMQFLLQQLTAIRGGAEPELDYFDEDEDDDLSEAYQEEAEEEDRHRSTEQDRSRA
jgi:HNH endonuclease